MWNPSVVKKCVIRGYMPLLICGTGTTGTTYKNYGSHIADYKKFDPFGGGISTLNFNLQFLFEEYTKHRNTWSRSNQDLELVRYRGCQFKIYRHPTCDFFVQYNRKYPFQDSQLTGPKLHPANMMLTRKKTIIKSFKTQPKGRSTKTIRIRPPTLFTDKWYFQKDLAKVPLLNLGVSIGNLRFPFCRPQTDNTCIYFQVFSNLFSNMLSIHPDQLQTNYNKIINLLRSHWQETQSTGTLSNFQNPWRIPTVFNTFKTEEHIKDPPISTTGTNANKKPVPSTFSYTRPNSLWGDYIYTEKMIDSFQNNAKNYYSARKGQGTYSASEYLNHKTGIFSPIFFSRQRLSPDFPGFYTEVIYNPQNDRGIGNKVWIDSCVKQDAKWTPGALKYPIVDVPLWMAFMGYIDYVTKASNSPGYWKECRITIICPYTEPPLYNPEDVDQGYVPYDYTFGDGKMPDGASYIPIDYRFKWYPCAFHQQNFQNDMAQCGPFAYDGSEKSAVLSAKYKFTFYFGGNPISEQTIKDPAQQPTYPFPDTSGQPPTVQVTDPSLINEGYFFKRWDIRRGIFGEKAIKRVSAQQIFTEFLADKPKRSRLEVPAIAEEGSSSQRERYQIWSPATSSASRESKKSQEETPETPELKQQLIRHIQEQNHIKSKLQQLVKQLVKTQCHLHAPIFP